MKLKGKFDKQRLFIKFRIKGLSLHAKAKFIIGIIDTGFDGFVMLPQNQFSELGLQSRDISTIRTADGTDHEAWSTECKYISDIFRSLE